MSARPVDSEALLTPSEVADLFHVDPKTVTRWARSGKISSIRTLGGHRRYREAEVRALLGGVPVSPVSTDAVPAGPVRTGAVPTVARQVPHQPVSTRG